MAHGNLEPVYGGDGKATYTFSNQGMAGYAGSLAQIRSLAQKNTQAQVKYDHLWEQKSIISPYDQMEHAWTKDEFDKEDEVVWHKQTQADVGQSDDSHPAYGNSAPVYGGNGKPTYTFHN